MDYANCCFIREAFFLAHPEYHKILDPGNTLKQSRRTYIYIRLEIDENRFYLPLRKNLGQDIRKYGRIGHAVPSKSRPNAGIDYRYALIVNDATFIEPHTSQKLPEAQYRIIEDDYKVICREFETYLRKYIRAAKKGRIEREPLFRESSLIQFHRELGIW